MRAAVRSMPETFWRRAAERGIINKRYLDWINCVDTQWEPFRKLYVEHMESRQWNNANEANWIMHPSNWQLVKAAEDMLQLWWSKDLMPGSNFSDVKAYDRQPLRSGHRLIHNDLIGTLAHEHLKKLASPIHMDEDESFGGTCLHGLIAAIAVFARALSIMGQHTPLGESQDDGYLLWRVEIGYLISGLLLHEGALVIDLVPAPGWPGVTSRLVEQILTNPLRGEMGYGSETAVLGPPRMLQEPKPQRFPHHPRYHRATDPQGITNWGVVAMERMDVRQNIIIQEMGTGGLPSWHRLGPPYMPSGDGPKLGGEMPGKKKLRALAVISSHGALDLEIPSLLQELFGDLLNMRYVLHGERITHLCDKTEGSAIIDELCEDHRRHGRTDNISRELPRDDPRLLTEPWWLDPADPRFSFSAEAEGAAALPADLVLTCHWRDALWFRKNFPSAALVLFFGPPVLLTVMRDIELGRTVALKAFWRGFYDLVQCSTEGFCLVAGESLFRTEQFYYQAGVEVPFLRPMSVWVNSSYCNAFPTSRCGAPGQEAGEVLVHNRGRLRYETAFIGSLWNMGGPSFPFTFRAQGGRIIPFKDLGKYHAMVFLPWSPELCMLRHVFKMRMPTLVPARNLLRNMVHISNQRLMPYPYNKPVPGSNRQKIESDHPYDPFVDTALWPAQSRGAEARIYWAEYSEYLLIEGLQHFEGAADLVLQVHSLDVRKVSARMHSAYLHDMEEMRSFWAATLPTLVRRA